MQRIGELVAEYSNGSGGLVTLEVGSQIRRAAELAPVPGAARDGTRRAGSVGRLNPEFTFETHVEGKSNQVARRRHARSVRTRAGHTIRFSFTAV